MHYGLLSGNQRKNTAGMSSTGAQPRLFERAQWMGYAGVLGALLSACAAMSPRPPVPISEVVALSRAGTPPDAVIAQLRRTVYAPRGSDFGKLADLGVQPPVLDFIQVRFVNTIELLTRHYTVGGSLGGCTDCFPQPLDLANLASGGNGMSPDVPTGRRTGAGRPPGVPVWVPGSPGIAFRNAPGLTVDEIARRAREGVPAEELVRQIRSSRLDGLIGQGLISTGGITLGTRSAVRLTGSTLASLRAQGVPDAVLDALQEQYLAQFIEFQRLRLQNQRPTM
jgi:hypothetical protein